MNILYKLFTLRASIIIFAIFLVLGSCSSDEPSGPNQLRLLIAEVNGVTLKEPQNNVDPEAGLQLVFSHPLNINSFESSFSLTSAGDPVDYSFVYANANSFVTINIEGRLGYETAYTLSLDQGIMGENGEELVESLMYNFTTAEFLPPTVALTASKATALEGEEVVLTASLNETSVADVSFDLVFEGTAAGSGTDYSVSAESIQIPAGEESASVNLTVISDGLAEGEETIIIRLSNLINVIETAPQQVLISLNDELPALALKGVTAIRYTGETDGNSGKTIHLIAVDDIPDLSVYGIGVANNGGGTDGVEYTFPNISVAAGEQILLAREITALEAYFGTCFSEFDHVIETTAPSQNGNDAIELFKGTNIIETFGDADIDALGQEWEYTGSWAYKLGGEWIYGGVNCAAASTTTQNADCVYPLCAEPLALQGVLALLWDGSGTNGGKAVHLRAYGNIADLSQYAIGVANNGGGTDGPEFPLPTMAAKEGDHILIVREPETLASYIGICFDKFDLIITSDAMTQNGDDAIELFDGANVIETYGDANVDGTDQVWDYTGSWAYKVNSSWTYGGVNCATTSTSTQTSDCPYQFCQ